MYILIHIRLLGYVGGKWLKNFHLTDFRKQDYFFWPECLKPTLNRKLSDRRLSKHTDLF